MKVRQLRKRKHMPPAAKLQQLIRRGLFRLLRKGEMRNDAAGRAAAGRVIERYVREYLEHNGPPTGWQRYWP